MDKVSIKLPSIRDDEGGYNYLFRLAQDIQSNPIRQLDFNFSKCAILDQNAVAMLGGLARYIDKHNTLANRGLSGIILPRAGVMFEVDTMTQPVRAQLIKNNFLSHFSKKDFEGYPRGDYIGYREHDKFLDANEIALHLHDQWLSDEKLSISPSLKNAIISRIFEIFMNAYGHGISRNQALELGVTSAGQHKPKERQLKLTVLDFGRGISENVREHLQNGIDDISAMEWALKTGNSTQTDSTNEQMPRGLGFGLLNDFVSINQGDIKIYSNSCYALIDKNGNYRVNKLKTPFNGTIVSITINCDGRHYKFVSDSSDTTQYF